MDARSHPAQPTAIHLHRVPGQRATRAFFTATIGYQLSGFPAGTHVGMPARSLTLILPFESAIVISGRAADGAGRPLREPTPFAGLVGGIHDSPVHIHHDGHQAGIEVDLTPAGARALLGMPSSELAGHVISLADVVGAGARHLLDGLAAAPDWPTRVALVEQLLVGRLERGLSSLERASQRDPATWHAWRLLAGSDGTLPVAEVARRVGWSRRQLTTRFGAEFGHPPKVAARVMRFERSHRLVRQTPTPRLADVAAACGYADQAHLTREWRDLAGCTPTQWLATEVFPTTHDVEVVEGSQPAVEGADRRRVVASRRQTLPKGSRRGDGTASG